MTSVDSLLAAWLGTTLGRSVRSIEQGLVSEALSQVFGLQMLQIGTWGQPGEFLSYGQTRRHALVGCTDGNGADVITRASALSIATATIDVVVLPHTLETEDNPHELLREVDRILVGEGHLLVLGFSKISLWGLRRAVSGGRFPPAVQRFISAGRLRDWLALLGFEVLETKSYCYIPPLDSRSLLSRDRSFERIGRRTGILCGAYLLLAQKHVYAITPVRPRWQKKRQVITGLAEPTTRNSR